MIMKRFTRRDFLKSAAVGTAGVAMAACIPADTAAPASDMPGAEGVTLRFMSRPHSQLAQEVFPDIINDNFTENTDPPINVNVETAASGWADKLVTSMIAGDSVDIFQAWPDIFYVWVAKDLILDIQPYVDRDLTQADLDDFIEAQWTRVAHPRHPCGHAQIHRCALYGLQQGNLRRVRSCLSFQLWR